MVPILVSKDVLSLVKMILKFMVQSRNSSHCCMEDNISKWKFFWFPVCSWGTHLLSFFTFPICFKCWMTVEWLTLSSWATSCTVVRGLGLMITLNWSLSTADASHCNLHLQGSRFLCITSWTTTALYVCQEFLDYWCCELSFLFYRPFWTQI